MSRSAHALFTTAVLGVLLPARDAEAQARERRRRAMTPDAIRLMELCRFGEQRATWAEPLSRNQLRMLSGMAQHRIDIALAQAKAADLVFEQPAGGYL